MGDLIYRQSGLEMRAEDTNDGHTITLQLISPDAPDQFGTLWHPHSLDAKLEERMPLLNYSHDQTEAIGRAIDYRTSDKGPAVRFLFDDFEDVHRARQAWTQVRPREFEGRSLPPAITDCSICFARVPGGTQRPTNEQRSMFGGNVREYVTQAEAVHAALVQKGAVGGAKVLAVRSAIGATLTVPEDFVIDLARKVAAKEITSAEAHAALDLVAAGAEPALPADGDQSPSPEEEAEVLEVQALLDQALDEL